MLIEEMRPIEPAAGGLTFLVGDVGGTNCRLALAQPAAGRLCLFHARGYKCAEVGDAEEAIAAYLQAVTWDAPIHVVVLAIAGPIERGAVRSTNMHWRLSEAALVRATSARARLINDYSGLALSVAALRSADLWAIGPDLPGDAVAPLAVLGAGTGFGAALLAHGAGGGTPIATEGGHAAFAPGDEIELEILRLLMRRFGQVSIERLLSGPGLVNLRRALAELAGIAAEDISPEEIVRQADAGDFLCQQTLDRFCAIYGAAAGDFALAYGARGGVFLGGGIAPAILGRLSDSAFRARFEQKGRFSEYMAAIPTRVIVNTQAALLGAALLAWRIVGEERREQRA